MRMGVRHIGQPRSKDAIVSAQLPQKRECPLRMPRATPSRGWSRQTSQQSEVCEEAATDSADPAVKLVAFSVSASSTLSAGSDSSALSSGRLSVAAARAWCCGSQHGETAYGYNRRCRASRSTSAGESRSSAVVLLSCMDDGSAVRFLSVICRSCSPRWLDKDCVTRASIVAFHVCSCLLSAHCI